MTQARINRFLDEHEITSVLIKERFHRDHGEWDEWRDCYHPDPKRTKIHTSLYHGEIDGFITLAKNTPGKFFDSFHTVSPAVIDINGSKSLTKSLGTVRASFTKDDGQRYDCVVDVVMVTRLEWTGSETGWRITDRKAIYRRDRIVPASPPEIVAEVNNGERRVVCRNLDWLAHFGGNEFDRGVLGFDEPEKVESFLGDAREWLITKQED